MQTLQMLFNLDAGEQFNETQQQTRSPISLRSRGSKLFDFHKSCSGSIPRSCSRVNKS